MPPKSEKEVRLALIWRAREVGAEAELLKIFERYDNYLKLCRTEEEKYAVRVMGVLEIKKFFNPDGKDQISIDGNIY